MTSDACLHLKRPHIGLEPTIVLNRTIPALTICRQTPNSDVDATGGTCFITETSGSRINGLLSRRHAELRFGVVNGCDLVMVTDIGSLNGTYIDNAIIIPHAKHALHHGNVLSFGGPAHVKNTAGEVFRNPFMYTLHMHV
jgi:pSer/pThr/pTyr-binding forkhead associated (FHA) protein